MGSEQTLLPRTTALGGCGGISGVVLFLGAPAGELATGAAPGWWVVVWSSRRSAVLLHAISSAAASMKGRERVDASMARASS